MKRNINTLAVMTLAVIVLTGCVSKQRQTVQPNATPHYERVSAKSSIDKRHALALRVDLFAGESPQGLTPLQIIVSDARGQPVSDAIVYAQTDSTTRDTPKVTLLAISKGDGLYRVDLPLVYGSHWLFMVKAFSAGRNAAVRVEEDLQ